MSLRLGIIAFLFVLAAPSVQAQTPPPDRPLSPAETRQIVTDAAAAIERYHHDAQTGAAIASALRTRLSRGGFDRAEGALALTRAVGAVLRPFGDSHLRFGYTATAQPLGFEDEHAAAQPAQEAADWRRDGYGIRRVDRLEGNVGLLRIDGAPLPTYAAEAWGSAMRLLDGSDALIIDVRENMGGSPEMVAFLLSWFMPGEPTRLFDFVQRNDTRQFWTSPLDSIPAYVGKPVFILTSRRTHSAGEAIAYHLQTRGLARIVGETSRGGANGSRWLVIHPHFAITLPWARSVSPVTGGNWQGVGVRPDISTSAEAAPDTAHRAALTELIARASDAESREALEAVLRSLDPAPTISARQERE